ncbi:MAG: hypothetical protein AB8B80_13030, partial [Marinicellaceae bacterium]
TISDCLIPDLQRLMFNEVTFIKKPYVKDKNFKTVKNNCKSNLLHEITIEYLNLDEKNEKLINSSSDNLRVQKISNKWMEFYILKGKQLDKHITFQIFIKDKYYEDKYIYINGWPESSKKLESYSQICKFLTVFYKNNMDFDLDKQHLESVCPIQK